MTPSCPVCDRELLIEEGPFCDQCKMIGNLTDGQMTGILNRIDADNLKKHA